MIYFLYTLISAASGFTQICDLLEKACRGRKCDPRAWSGGAKNGRFGITNKCIIRCVYLTDFSKSQKRRGNKG